MSKKKIVLNEDHLALIRNIKFEKFNFNADEKINHHYAWGIDEYNLFGGTSFVLEAIAVILGQYEKFIPGTEEDPTGRHYPPELESYWWGLYSYIWDNLEYIISLVLYSVTEGGLTPGVYQYDTDTYEWEKRLD